MTITNTRMTFAKRIPVLIAVGALALGATHAAAAPITGGAGLEYYAGAGDQITKSALVTAGIGVGEGSATLGLLRYDDSFVGMGTGVIGAVAFPLAPSASMQLVGARFLGDESFRGWRVKAGPRFSAPTGASLGLYYTHYQDNAEGKQDGALAEAAVPVAPQLGLRASAGYASVGEDVNASQGSIGLAWTPVRFLELSGEAGLARNGGVAGAPAGPGRGLRLPPILGGPDPEPVPAESKTEPTMLLGVRFTFP